MEILNMFSRYEMQARIFPAFIALSPIAATVLIWYPELISLESSFLTLFVLLIMLFSLAKIARESGKKVEKELIAEQGGYPSTEFLKHSNNSLNVYTKERYHQYLNENIPGLQLPSEEQELENPRIYHEKYVSAIQWLLEKSRDSNRFPLLYEDNINYGYSRNMVGIKNIGIFFAVVSLLIDTLGIYQKYNFSSLDMPLKIFLSIFISVFFIFYWVFAVKKEWVRSTSKAYARTLLSVCEQVD